MLWTRPVVLAIAVCAAISLSAQDPRQIVKEAVQTELDASANDHSHWIYFEIDRRPERTVKQWVAEAQHLSLNRVVERDGQPLSEAQQRNEISSFINDTRAQAKQRKSGEHDDEQAEELTKMLPDGFSWTIVGEKDNNVVLHFTPNPAFHPPDLESRVFAGMEGEIIPIRELFTFHYRGDSGDGHVDGDFESARTRPDFTVRAAHYGLDRELIEALGIGGA